MSAPLAEVDPDIAELLGKELGRQRDTLEMIASENFVPRSVLQAQGSVLTNKYAEGLPGRRYYGGCEYVDVVENIARDRAKALFGADFANVQPHSGAQANAAVLHALMVAGRAAAGPGPGQRRPPDPRHEAQLLRQAVRERLLRRRPTTHLIDMDAVRAQALEFRPKVIIAGWSAYPRILDFAAFRSIADEVDAKLWVDMAHFAGLVAAGLHPSPVPHADVVSTTIHKTLRWWPVRDDPGQTGVRQGHQLGGVPRPARRAADAHHRGQGRRAEDRRDTRIRRTAAAHAVRRPDPGRRLLAADVAKAGVSVVSGGTDVHLVLVDLRNSPLDGQAAEDLLHEAGITVNRNAVPNDPRPPMVTSGLRIGTPALATRGFGDDRVRRGCRRHRHGAGHRRFGRRRIRAAAAGGPAG